MLLKSSLFRRAVAAIALSTALFVPFALQSRSQPTSLPPIIGRWDVTVQTPRGSYPAWFEVVPSGYKTLVGRFVGQFGSARPIGKVGFENGTLRFTVPPQWESRKDDLTYTGRLENGKLSGTTTDENSKTLTWTAVRAPDLKRNGPGVPGSPITLFNGKSMAGWKGRTGKHGWQIVNGTLSNVKPGQDLMTEGKFTDFKLHIEFRYPSGSNSGVYLRGRHEVQIEDNYGQEPEAHKIGAVYGFLTPNVNAAKKPGEWQMFDITLRGRVVTIIHNGERVLDRQTIPGITGGAIDSKEGDPGPLLIQGDHGPVEYRNIVLTPLK